MYGRKYRSPSEYQRSSFNANDPSLCQAGRSRSRRRGLCIQAAAALAPHNIRVVNCINSGATDTGYLTGEADRQVANMFLSDRWGTPEDAAKLVHFLHSDYAKWISQTIASGGGFKR